MEGSPTGSASISAALLCRVFFVPGGMTMTIKRTGNPAQTGSFAASEIRIPDSEGTVSVFDTSSCLVFLGG